MASFYLHLNHQVAKILTELFPNFSPSLEFFGVGEGVAILMDRWTPQETEIVAESSLEAIGIPKIGIYFYIGFAIPLSST